jgi:site-specific recombinase XerC
METALEDFIHHCRIERRLLRVRKAKGSRQRIVPIHPALEPLFLDYLQVRAGDSEPALFVGVQGNGLSQSILTPDLPPLRACPRASPSGSA